MLALVLLSVSLLPAALGFDADPPSRPLAGKGIDLSKVAPFVDIGLAAVGSQAVFLYNDKAAQDCYDTTGGVESNEVWFIAKSAYEFSSEVSGRLNIEGGSGAAFKASATTSLERSSDISTKRFFGKKTWYQVSQSVNINPACLEDQGSLLYLDQGFVKSVHALVNEPALPDQYREVDHAVWQTFFQFLDTFGTHLVVGEISGASLDVTISQQSNSKTNENSMSASLHMSYGLFFDFSSEASEYVKKARSDSQLNIVATVIGGDAETAGKLNEALATQLQEPSKENADKVKALQTKWEASAANFRQGSVMSANFKAWHEIDLIGRLARESTDEAQVRVLMQNLRKAADVKLKLSWRNDCLDGSWNDAKLMCEVNVHADDVEQWILLKNRDAISQYVRYDERQQALTLTDDKSNATEFMFKEDGGLKMQLDHCNPLSGRYLVAGSSPAQFLTDSHPGSDNSRFLMTSQDHIRLAATQDASEFSFLQLSPNSRQQQLLQSSEKCDSFSGSVPGQCVRSLEPTQQLLEIANRMHMSPEPGMLAFEFQLEDLMSLPPELFDELDKKKVVLQLDREASYMSYRYSVYGQDVVQSARASANETFCMEVVDSTQGVVRFAAANGPTKNMYLSCGNSKDVDWKGQLHLADAHGNDEQFIISGSGSSLHQISMQCYSTRKFVSTSNGYFYANNHDLVPSSGTMNIRKFDCNLPKAPSSPKLIEQKPIRLYVSKKHEKSTSAANVGLKWYSGDHFHRLFSFDVWDHAGPGRVEMILAEKASKRNHSWIIRGTDKLPTRFEKKMSFWTYPKGTEYVNMRVQVRHDRENSHNARMEMSHDGIRSFHSNFEFHAIAADLK